MNRNGSKDKKECRTLCSHAGYSGGWRVTCVPSKTARPLNAAVCERVGLLRDQLHWSLHACLNRHGDDREAMLEQLIFHSSSSMRWKLLSLSLFFFLNFSRQFVSGVFLCVDESGRGGMRTILAESMMSHRRFQPIRGRWRRHLRPSATIWVFPARRRESASSWKHSEASNRHNTLILPAFLQPAASCSPTENCLCLFYISSLVETVKMFFLWLWIKWDYANKLWCVHVSVFMFLPYFPLWCLCCQRRTEGFFRRLLHL